MNHSIVIRIFLVILLIAIFVSLIWLRKFRFRRSPNYRALFALGITWLPMGIIFNITLLWILGLIFFIIGIANKKKWDKASRWRDLSPGEKKIKMMILAGTSILMIISVLTYFYVMLQ